MIDAKDLDLLAKTLWAEARGEGIGGMIAVGCVIRNRVEIANKKTGKPHWWGVGYGDVVTKGYAVENGRVIHQFSCWNKEDSNYPYLIGMRDILAHEYETALACAKVVVENATVDTTLGATHYYSTTLSRAPNWIMGATRTVKIGRHVFYKDVK